MVSLPTHLWTFLIDRLSRPAAVLEIGPEQVELKAYRYERRSWPASSIKQRAWPSPTVWTALTQGEIEAVSQPELHLFFKQFLMSVKAQRPKLKMIHLVLSEKLAAWQTQLVPAASQSEVRQSLDWEESEAGPAVLKGFRTVRETRRDGLSQAQVVVGRLSPALPIFFSDILASLTLALGKIWVRWPSDVAELIGQVPVRGPVRPWQQGLMFDPAAAVGKMAGADRPGWSKLLRPAAAGFLLLLLAGCFLSKRQGQLPADPAPETASQTWAVSPGLSPSGEASAAAFPSSPPASPPGAEDALARAPSGTASSAQSLFQDPVQGPAGLSPENLAKSYRLEGVVLGRRARAIFAGPAGHFVLADRQDLAGGWQLIGVDGEGVRLRDRDGQEFTMLVQ